MKQVRVIRRFSVGHWRKIGLGTGVLGVAAIAFCCGRWNNLPQANALPPAPAANNAKEVAPPRVEPRPDYSQRAVAYIHGTIMITREELGEYLIAREGTEKLQYLVNRRIIEHACKEKGIEVSPAEVDAALAQDLKELKITRRDFETRLLKEYRKTLYEWKEDVIWPKLALTKLGQGRVRVEPQDLERAFQAYYGPKVEGRIILFPLTEKHQVLNNIWPKLRDSEEEFNRFAKQQASRSLNSQGGKIPPIGRYTTGNEEMEKEVFGLRPGEITKVIEAPEGLVIFKCDRIIPANANVKPEQARASLEKEILDKKTQAEMPRLFKEMMDKAQPKLFLQKDKSEEALQQIKAELPAEASPPPRISGKGN